MMNYPETLFCQKGIKRHIYQTTFFSVLTVPMKTKELQNYITHKNVFGHYFVQNGFI